MRNRMFARATCAGIAAAVLLAGAGCTDNPGDTADLSQRYAPVRVKSTEQTKADEKAESSVIKLHSIHRTGYVSLADVAKAAGYTGKWLDDGSYGVGDHDPRWKFRTGDSQVQADGKVSRLPAPAVKENNSLYVPASGLSALFGNELAMRTNKDTISLLPRAFGHNAGHGGMPFVDAVPGGANGGKLRVASASSDAADIIAHGQKFLGVKYDFGAGDYEKTGLFDCSSFVQYLFADKGILLPRTAREQAQRGTSVSRNELQPGDLMFFYVPGRFKTDNTVGHVGIYMGGGKMLHSSPKPEDGVQITDIDKAYWQDTFLYAKRLL
ncbi:NlpC/P60 family protein [Cohnella sp. GCM10020058]|uniref:C40 family peptidase n=1 Tax=Cohnella sp. GCM10020058 TaxID=3317330 RepID=UPI0036406F2F